MENKEYKVRLIDFYKNEVVPALQKELNYKNPYQVPAINKIILNMRLGDVKDNSKSFNMAIDELTAIAGQKTTLVYAKKSLSNFKLRAGMKIGGKVTLRGKIMYEFLDKLISVALPRVRDFRGLPKTSFDGKGNYSLGIKEHLIFPEISYDKIEKIRGLDISIITTAKNDSDALALFRAIGLPIVD